MFGQRNRRASIILLTSAVCLAAWHLVGNYNFWQTHVTAWMPPDADPQLAAGIGFLASNAILLGIVPLLVVKLVLREPLSDYGLALAIYVSA